MKALLSLPIGQNRSSARVVDGKLILSFPDALTPVLWQMDLSEAKASALEVLPGENKSHVLTLRTARGESLEIAPFATREEAVQGLMAVAHALENAHGQIRPGAALPSRAPIIRRSIKVQAPGGAGRWVAAALGVLFVFVLFSTWASLSPRPPSSMGSGAPGVAPQNSAGVPLSADDYLKGM